MLSRLIVFIFSSILILMAFDGRRMRLFPYRDHPQLTAGSGFALAQDEPNHDRQRLIDYLLANSPHANNRRQFEQNESDVATAVAMPQNDNDAGSISKFVASDMADTVTSVLSQISGACGREVADYVHKYLKDTNIKLILSPDVLSNACLSSLNRLAADTRQYHQYGLINSRPFVFLLKSKKDLKKLALLADAEIMVWFNGVETRVRLAEFDDFTPYQSQIIGVNFGNTKISRESIDELARLIQDPESRVQEVMFAGVQFKDVSDYDRLIDALKSPLSQVSVINMDSITFTDPSGIEETIGDPLASKLFEVLQSHPGRTWSLSLAGNELTHKSMRYLKEAAEYLSNHGGLKIEELEMARNNFDSKALSQFARLLDAYEIDLVTLDLSWNTLVHGEQQHQGYKRFCTVLSGKQNKLRVLKLDHIPGFGKREVKMLSDVLKARQSGGEIMDTENFRQRQDIKYPAKVTDL